jgi:hypothetical protein
MITFYDKTELCHYAQYLFSDNLQGRKVQVSPRAPRYRRACLVQEVKNFLFNRKCYSMVPTYRRVQTCTGLSTSTLNLFFDIDFTLHNIETANVALDIASPAY